MPPSGCFIIQLRRRVLRVYWLGAYPGACFWSVFQEKAPSCVPALYERNDHVTKLSYLAGRRSLAPRPLHVSILFFSPDRPSRQGGRWETKHFMGMALPWGSENLKSKCTGFKGGQKAYIFLSSPKASKNIQLFHSAKFRPLKCSLSWRNSSLKPSSVATILKLSW